MLEGEGIRYTGAATFCGTAIIPTFNDRPCFAFQGARFSELRNMSIVGKMVDYVTTNHLGTIGGALVDDTVPANWIDPAFPASASSQYAPYCGVAIDPYSGAPPATHYPNVTYPAFLGAVSQYNKNSSSNVLLENVSISGFVVGVAVQPCNADSNGDFTKLHRCEINKCAYGIAVCQTQSRLVHLLDCSLTLLYTGITTADFGVKNGKPQIKCTSTQFSDIIYWINAPTVPLGGGPKFDSCYGEVVWAIGTVGGAGSTGCTSTFDQCEWDFGARHTRGEPQYTLANTGQGMVLFRGCKFANGSSDPSRLHFSGFSYQYRFEGCNNQLTAFATNLYEKFALNATGGITFAQLTTRGVEFGVYNGFLWNLTSGASPGPKYYGSRDSGKRDELVSVYAQHIVEGATLGNPGVDVSFGPALTLSKAALSYTVVGRSVTFDTGYPDYVLRQQGGEVGDCVWDSVTGTLFYVRSRTGSQITMDAQTNYTAAGALRTALNNSGFFYFLNCRSYTTNAFLQGTSTAANNQLTSCGTGNGAPYSNSDIAVSDFLAIFDQVNPIVTIASAGNQITARDGPGQTITLTANASVTRVQRLPLFWRAAPPNV